MFTPVPTITPAALLRCYLAVFNTSGIAVSKTRVRRPVSSLGGRVSVTTWVGFCLAFSVLSLMVTRLFSPEIVASRPEQLHARIAGVFQQRAEAFLRRRCKTVVALMCLLFPTICQRPDGTRRRRRSQPRTAGSVDGPVLRHERPLPPDDRPAVLRRRPVVRPGHLCAVEELAGPSHHARNLRADLRDLQNLPHHPGQVHSRALGVHRGHHLAVLRLPGAGTGQIHRGHPAHHSAFSASSASPAATAWRGSEFASTPSPTPAQPSPDCAANRTPSWRFR